MDNFDFLTAFLEEMKSDLVHTLQVKGRYASGSTAEQLDITAGGSTAQLTAPGYLMLLENGRSPTGSNAVAADPPMIDRIRLWCQEKGIPDKAAWAIKKAIDKNGFKGTPGLISTALSTENISLRLDPELEKAANSIVTDIAALIS